MSLIEESLGVNVLGDWDNFFENRLRDYYTTKEKVDGWTFLLEKGVVTGSEDVAQAVRQTKLHLITRNIKQNIVLLGVVTGPGINGNPYNLAEQKLFIVDIYDRNRKLFYTIQELVSFVNKININTHNSTFIAGPVIGVIDFRNAVEAVQNLEDGASTDSIELEVENSLNVLRDAQSLVNQDVQRKGIICQGVFGYTFYHE